MTIQEWCKEYKEVKLEVLYINSHTLENIEKRFKIKTLALPKKIEYKLYIQKYKNNMEINDIKAIFFHNDIVFIVNIYEKDDKLYGKLLTALSRKQFALSRNFNFGLEIKVPCSLTMEIIEIKTEDVYFKVSEYTNITKSLEDYIVEQKFERATKEEFEHIDDLHRINVDIDGFYKVTLYGEKYIIGRQE